MQRLSHNVDVLERIRENNTTIVNLKESLDIAIEFSVSKKCEMEDCMLQFENRLRHIPQTIQDVQDITKKLELIQRDIRLVESALDILQERELAFKYNAAKNAARDYKQSSAFYSHINTTASSSVNEYECEVENENNDVLSSVTWVTDAEEQAKFEAYLNSDS